MYKVYLYYDNGEIYHQLLTMKYLSSYKYTENKILDILHMERSTYYRKKKEAIMLLGISLLGYSIPEMKKSLNNVANLKINCN